jgi:hypothetical protein
VPERVSASVVKLLLALCAFFATGFAALGAYVYRTHARVQVLQAELGQKHELQQRMMEAVPSDHCLFPHFKNSVGYVFNPFLKEGTLWGSGAPYAINPFGLRGAPFGPRPAGRRRIVLVGDSWFFGWKMTEADKLQAHLQGLFKNVPWDVITVALPGWNVRSQAAFVNGHIRYLDPDVIVWSICQNDTWDVGGVVPPGTLGNVISAQNADPDGNAITLINRGLPVLPFEARRQRQNLALMAEVRARFGVPVLAAAVDFPPAEWAATMEGTSFDLPVQFIPPRYRTDARAVLSPLDSHPTPWLLQSMALGYAARLVDMGILPAESLKDADPEVLAEWRANGTLPDRAQVDRHLQAVASGLLAAYSTPADFQRVAAGIMDEGGRMGRHGLVHLNVPPGRGSVRFEFEAADYTPRFARQVTLAVRDMEGRETSTTRAFSGQRQRVVCDLALPPGPSRVPAYEIEWAFNYDECDYPTRCFSGHLARVSSGK